MTGPVYCTCGAILVQDVTDWGVQPVGSGEPIEFRRKTDYVVCPECLSTYSAAKLLEGVPVEEALLEPGDPPG